MGVTRYMVCLHSYSTEQRNSYVGHQRRIQGGHTTVLNRAR